MEEPEIIWHEMTRDWVEGQGWNDTENPFDRLPARAKVLVTEQVWNNSHSSTGMCFYFNSDSTRVHAKWELLNDQLGEANFNVCAFSGPDLYTGEKHPASGSPRWRWAGAPSHRDIVDKNPRGELVSGLSKEARPWRLYLPLRNALGRMFVGVEKGASFDRVAPAKSGFLVHYGSSIVHGAYAVRSGLGHAQQLGRMAGLPHINLGFSGAAKMELEVAELLGELPARIYLIDALPNMDAALVKERAIPFLRRLTRLKPGVPVVAVGDPANERAWLRPAQMKEHLAKWSHLESAIQTLQAEGVKNLHHIPGQGLMGDDSEVSIDGIHPNDVGFMRMAEKIAPVLKQVLTA